MCEEWSSCHGNQIGAPWWGRDAPLSVTLQASQENEGESLTLGLGGSTSGPSIWVDSCLSQGCDAIREAGQSQLDYRLLFLSSLSHQELPCSPIVLSEPLRVKTEPSFCQAFSTVTQMWLMSNDFPPISVRGWREQTWCFEISICQITEMSENVCFQFVILTKSQAGRSL